MVSQLNYKGVKVNWMKKKEGMEKLGVEVKVEGPTGRGQPLIASVGAASPYGQSMKSEERGRGSCASQDPMTFSAPSHETHSPF